MPEAIPAFMLSPNAIFIYPSRQKGITVNYPNQQQQQLPFPNNSQVAPFLGLNYGQPPFVPNVQCAQPLMQWLPLIAYEAINTLQTDAQRSGLRMFLYNQMSYNGYQNQDFHEFVTRLADLVNLIMLARGGQDVQRTIQEAALMYTKYKSADNCLKYPALMAGFPQSDAMQIDFEHKRFLQTVQQMEMTLQRNSGNQMGYQQPMQNPGYGQPIGGFGGQQQPQPYRPPMNQLAQPYTPPGGGRFNAPGQSTNWRDNGPATPFSSPAGLYHNQPPEATDTGKWSNQPPFNANKFTTSSAPEVTLAIAARTEAIPTQTAPGVQSPVTSMAPPEPAKSSNAGLLVKAGDPGVDWVSSEKYPYTFAFNPNRSQIYYRFDEDGKMQPILTKKEISPMDRQIHLATPSIAPSWSTAIPTEATVFDSDSAIVSTYQKLEDLVQVEHVPPLATAISNVEHIAKAKVAVDSNAHITLPKNKRPAFIMFPGVTVDTVAVQPQGIAVVEKIVETPTVNNIAAVLETLTDDAALGNTPNQKLKRAINRRLTARVNKFIKKELALTSGSIGNYEEDIRDLGPYLASQFGAATAKIFNDAHPRLVKEALTFATGSSAISIEDTYFDFVPKKEDQLVSQISFLDFNQYLYIDLTSIDLALDLATLKSAVGLLESELPLVYALAKKALTGEEGISLHNYYLVTSDDVVFEVTRGAINPEYIFISLAQVK